VCKARREEIAFEKGKEGGEGGGAGLPAMNMRERVVGEKGDSKEAKDGD